MKSRRFRMRHGLAVALLLVMGVAGVLLAADSDPVFLRFLRPDDPDDETLRNYWERFELEELEAVEMVDLGTMLYHRGFPSDAIRMYRSALDVDRNLVEAWLRIGLVQQSQGEFDDADQAYRRCLKKSPGHGWCNFYLGLLEEKRGHGKSAAFYLEQAFKHAPRLADPYYNPAVLDSKLALGAELINFDRRKMQAGQPMPYLQPGKVERVRRQYEPEIPEIPAEPDEPAPTEESQAAPATSIVVSSEPESKVDAGQQHPITPNYGSPTPVPQRPPRSIPVRRAPSPSYERPYGSGETGRSTGEEPPVAPPIGSVSGEARLLPYGTALSDLIDWLV